MANIISSLKERYAANRDARKSKRNLSKAIKTLNKRLESQLPIGLMKGKDYNTAVANIRDLTKKSDMQGAREYVRSQLNKSMQQAYAQKDMNAVDYIRNRANRK